jgi:transposase-like protein
LEAAYAELLEHGLDGAGEALRILVNEAAKIERAEFLGAKPYERTATRRDYANGYKPKTMLTRLGEVTFQVPKCAAAISILPPWRKARVPTRQSTWRWPRCTSRVSPPGG